MTLPHFVYIRGTAGAFPQSLQYGLLAVLGTPVQPLGRSVILGGLHVGRHGFLAVVPMLFGPVQ